MNDTDTDEDLHDVFNFFDRDNSEGISVEEFLFVANSMGAQINEKLVKKIIDEGRTKGSKKGESMPKDGSLGFEGFISVMMGVNAP